MIRTRNLNATWQWLEKDKHQKTEASMSMNSSPHYVNADGATMTRLGFFLAIVMMVFAIPQNSLTQVGSFVSFDAPGASLTMPFDVNNSGVIVGRYDDQNGAHGFVLNQGVVTTVDFPGAALTDGNAINDSGLIVGDYVDSSGKQHGYIAQFSQN
jgi:hypothetical protein